MLNKYVALGIVLILGLTGFMLHTYGKIDEVGSKYLDKGIITVNDLYGETIRIATDNVHEILVYSDSLAVAMKNGIFVEIPKTLDNLDSIKALKAKCSYLNY
jgi:hypothetical protein